MPRCINLILLLLVVSVTSCESQTNNRTFQQSAAQTEFSDSKFLPVTKIVDGDTFWVNDGSVKGLKVRLIGVDAPESRKVFKNDVEYYGKEAKIYLTNMLQSKKVRLVSDVGLLDRFGRTLSYVYLEDGTFVNAHLVQHGYAMVMTVPPNVQFADEFAML